MASYSYTDGIRLNNQTLLFKPSFIEGVPINIPLFNRRKAVEKYRKPGIKLK